jgi:predicted O-linked N-acetylglucosamine transferase (SPINDLY family)
VTFGSFSRPAKLNPRVAALWARVLAAVPGARLHVLSPGGEGNRALRRMLVAAGIAEDRLTLVPTAPRPQYLRLCQEVDVALDAFPYAGMTTTCDLLWVGVPVVTLAGGTAASRAGVSLLRTVRLPELVAATPDDYVRIAAGLANDLPRVRALRRELRRRTRISVLYRLYVERAVAPELAGRDLPGEMTRDGGGGRTESPRLSRRRGWVYFRSPLLS